ncbi:MAG: hypothetical protein JNL74_04380, partial [Fibrobacteres bacterium]|nr:hypothetical protein [Fibrobacterota bacterium]
MIKMLFLTLIISISAMSSVRVGMMPFKGEGFTPTELSTLTAKFQDELFK